MNWGVGCQDATRMLLYDMDEILVGLLLLLVVVKIVNGPSYDEPVSGEARPKRKTMRGATRANTV